MGQETVHPQRVGKPKHAAAIDPETAGQLGHGDRLTRLAHQFQDLQAASQALNHAGDRAVTHVQPLMPFCRSSCTIGTAVIAAALTEGISLGLARLRN